LCSKFEVDITKKKTKKKHSHHFLLGADFKGLSGLLNMFLIKNYAFLFLFYTQSVTSYCDSRISNYSPHD